MQLPSCYYLEEHSISSWAFATHWISVTRNWRMVAQEQINLLGIPGEHCWEVPNEKPYSYPGLPLMLQCNTHTEFKKKKKRKKFLSWEIKHRDKGTQSSINLLALCPQPRSHPACSLAPGSGKAPGTHPAVATECSLGPRETTLRILTASVSSRVSQKKQGIESMFSLWDELLKLLPIFSEIFQGRKDRGGREVLHRSYSLGKPVCFWGGVRDKISLNLATWSLLHA